MQTVEIDIYTFEELSDEAKNVARDWWRDLETADPAWLSEHLESRKLAIAAVANGMDLKPWRNCEVTGYTDDAILPEAIEAYRDEKPNEWDLDDIRRWVTDYYALAWQRECEYRHTDDEVDESIECNDYCFTKDGKFSSL